jgi:hypothetical protein
MAVPPHLEPNLDLLQTIAILLMDFEDPGKSTSKVLALCLHGARIAIGFVFGAKHLSKCDHLVMELIQSLLIKCAKPRP